MSDEAAFLRAICEHPEDDNVRLVYADWLQENGQPERAEFIRAECAQAALYDDSEGAPNEWDCPRYWELEERCRELYDQHASKWFKDLFKAHRGEVSTQRGFPHHVSITARKFITHGEALFRAAPTIANVFIADLGRHMPELARTPALEHVRELTFFETPFWEAEARELAASPYLGNLREFDIAFTDTQIGRYGARALANAKSIRQLQKLDIHNHAIGDEGAEAIIYSERLATLIDLNLGNNGLTDTTTAALSWATGLKLTSLDLMNNHLSGAGLVLSADHFAGLEYLSVQGNRIGYDGAVNLARMPCAANLRELRVANCDMDGSGIKALLEGSWPRLTELSLAMNEFGATPAKALAANRSLAQLAKLSVARCGIGPTAARVLGRVSLPALRRLDADNNSIGAKGLRALLAGPLVRPVRTLHIGECWLGDDGVEVLARSPAVANLRVLWLQDNGITNRGAIALAESPHLAEVQSLYMPSNKVKKKGRAALVKRFGDRVNLGAEE